MKYLAPQKNIYACASLSYPNPLKMQAKIFPNASRHKRSTR